LKHYAAAITDYNTAIRLDPDNIRAYYYRGLAKREIDRWGGQEDLQKALKLAEKMGDWKLHSVIQDAMWP
jgi:tetratricopeptide (TPR) repeat protein